MRLSFEGDYVSRATMWCVSTVIGSRWNSDKKESSDSPVVAASDFSSLRDGWFKSCKRHFVFLPSNNFAYQLPIERFIGSCHYAEPLPLPISFKLNSNISKDKNENFQNRISNWYFVIAPQNYQCHLFGKLFDNLGECI